MCKQKFMQDPHLKSKVGMYTRELGITHCPAPARTAAGVAGRIGSTADLVGVVDEQMQGLSRQLGHCCSEHQTAVATASHDGSKSTVAAVAAAVGTSYKRQ
jgi:hypothetical protein